MTRSFPQAAPRLRIARFRAAVDDAIRRVLESDSYILGDAVATFAEVRERKNRS